MGRIQGAARPGQVPMRKRQLPASFWEEPRPPTATGAGGGLDSGGTSRRVRGEDSAWSPWGLETAPGAHLPRAPAKRSHSRPGFCRAASVPGSCPFCTPWTAHLLSSSRSPAPEPDAQPGPLAVKSAASPAEAGPLRADGGPRAESVQTWSLGNPSTEAVMFSLISTSSATSSQVGRALPLPWPAGYRGPQERALAGVGWVRTIPLHRGEKGRAGGRGFFSGQPCTAHSFLSSLSPRKQASAQQITRVPADLRWLGLLALALRPPQKPAPPGTTYTHCKLVSVLLFLFFCKY